MSEKRKSRYYIQIQLKLLMYYYKMGVMYSMPSYNYYQLQERISLNRDITLINTLPLSRQNCLIKGTISASIEEEYMNKLKNKNKEIVIYGIHHTDLSVIKKYNQ